MSSETLPKSFAVQGYPVNSGPTLSENAWRKPRFLWQTTQRCHQQRDTFPLRIGTHPLLPDGVRDSFPLRIGTHILLPDGVVRPNASILGGGVLQRFTIRYQSSRHSR
ncbi:hypothetical protein HYQ46_004813 [Verticillium longisporum]|nr:hypothetical protein HYQ46_004813 [Verticillium longisporum]